jgi:hypothetical protein
MNDRARELAGDASTAKHGPERLSLLTSALAELGDAGGADDDLELRGVVLALLAEQDPSYLPGAEGVLSAARQNNAETNWISLHLADACYIAGDYKRVIAHAREVDRSYFEGQDLRWRSVKVTEILAASLLAQGHLAEGLDLANVVCAELAAHGSDSDEWLASPAELAHRALDLASNPASEEAFAAGCEILRAISSSIDVPEWFPKILADAITEALGQPFP